MTPCDGTATSEKWCCGDSNKCCLQGRDDFVLLAQTLGEPVPTSSANSDMNSATESSSITGSIPASSSTNTAAPESPRNGGLSTGAKAGIGVGAAVGALTLLAGGFFIAKALQWKKKAARAKEINNMGYAGEEQPIQYNSPYSDWQHTAIVQDQKVELNAAPDTHELPDHERRH